jgi:hypothetical protein
MPSETGNKEAGKRGSQAAARFPWARGYGLRIEVERMSSK